MNGKLDTVRKVLGQPAFATRSILVYQGDPLNALRKIPPRLFNLVIADPVQGIVGHTDVPMPLDDFLQWCERWMKEVHRVTAQDGALWIKLGQVPLPGRARVLPLSYLLWAKGPFSLVQEVVWNQGAGVPSNFMFVPGNERYLWLVKSLDQYTFHAGRARHTDTRRSSGRGATDAQSRPLTDVWFIPVPSRDSGRARQHTPLESATVPAPTTGVVIQTIVRCCSNPGDLVLDLFTGTGTTLLVASQARRETVGFAVYPQDVPLIRRQMLDRRPIERRRR